MSEILVLTDPTNPQVVLRDATGERVLPALWLRARSPDPSQRDAVTGQRLMNPHLLPDDLTVTGARQDGGMLHIAFSDGFCAKGKPICHISL